MNLWKVQSLAVPLLADGPVEGRDEILEGTALIVLQSFGISRMKG